MSKFEMFKLKEYNNEFVIIENLAKTSLDVARHSYLTAQMDYFVFYPERERLVIVYEDGKTWTINWGGSLSLVGDEIWELRNKLVQFILSEGINLPRQYHMDRYKRFC